METISREIENINNKYNDLKVDFMTIMEERNKRIETKIDKQFTEHEKQMKMILELLYRLEK